MIAIIGWIDVDPEVRDQVVASIAHLQAATRNDEPGCLAYVMAADPVQPERIQITELWQDAASLDAHFQHPNFVATGAAMRAVPRRGGSISKYRIDATDQVRGPDGSATSAFQGS